MSLIRHAVVDRRRLGWCGCKAWREAHDPDQHDGAVGIYRPVTSDAACDRKQEATVCFVFTAWADPWNHAVEFPLVVVDAHGHSNVAGRQRSPGKALAQPAEEFARV